MADVRLRHSAAVAAEQRDEAIKKLFDMPILDEFLWDGRHVEAADLAMLHLPASLFDALGVPTSAEFHAFINLVFKKIWLEHLKPCSTDLDRVVAEAAPPQTQRRQRRRTATEEPPTRTREHLSPGASANIKAHE